MHKSVVNLYFANGGCEASCLLCVYTCDFPDRQTRDDGVMELGGRYREFGFLTASCTLVLGGGGPFISVAF